MRVNGTLYYMLKDHLGSASVVTDSSGNIVGEQRYYPFGETRLATGSMYTDKLFTGQRNIAGLGIYHYQSRFYSPKLGRFLSADSLVPNPFNPQDFNRFSYVRNNPVRYIDPSGHVCSDPDAPNRTCENGAKYPVNAKPLGASVVVIKPASPAGQDLQQKKPKGGGAVTATTTTTILVLTEGGDPNLPTATVTRTPTPTIIPTRTITPTPTITTTPPTPTVTLTVTQTPTYWPSLTPTITSTPTSTSTHNPEGPFGPNDCVYEENCDEELKKQGENDVKNPFVPRPLPPGVGGPPGRNE